MKLTKTELQRIIQEELHELIEEEDLEEGIMSWALGMDDTAEERRKAGQNVYGKPGSKTQPGKPFDDPRDDIFPPGWTARDAEGRGQNVGKSSKSKYYTPKRPDYSRPRLKKRE